MHENFDLAARQCVNYVITLEDQEKSESNHKIMSSSANKRFFSTPYHDSASQSSSFEQLQRDHKTGKRRNSFDSAKPDQEPKDSSSSNCLPSYMQATESEFNGSPCSSPDVQDKYIVVKNRQSLPVTNVRQASPRIHRSLSQAQQNVKGNGVHSPQDRKWRR